MSHPASPPRPFTCGIVHHDTFGLRHEAKVLGEAIRAVHADARIFTWVPPKRWLESRPRLTIGAEVQAALPLDALFLFEHCHLHEPFLEAAFAKALVFVPNIEWLLAEDEAVLRAGRIPTVLHKNRYSYDLFMASGLGAHCRDVRLTGWTSTDVGLPEPGERQDGTCLHIRGTSLTKHAEVVVAAWLRNPDFPHLTVVASGEPIGVPIPSPAPPNLSVLFRPLPEPELRALQRRAAIHISPSKAETFAHALNEARSTGALLVTTDGPPMRDFVEDGVSGVLVPVRPENVQPHHLSKSYAVTVEDLEAILRRVLRLSPDERRCIGRAARAAYEQEGARFREAFRALLTEHAPR